MKLLPHKNITFQTKLSCDEVKQVLNSVVEPRQSVRSRRKENRVYHKPYEGEVGNDNFDINRASIYRSDFKPIITGKFHNHLDETIIEVDMKLPKHTIIFMLAWISVVALFLVFHLSTRSSSSYDIVVLFLMLGCGIALPLVTFLNQSEISEEDLRGYFEVKQEFGED